LINKTEKLLEDPEEMLYARGSQPFGTWVPPNQTWYKNRTPLKK